MSTLLDPTHCNMVRLDIPENLGGECIVVVFFKNHFPVDDDSGGASAAFTC